MKSIFHVSEAFSEILDTTFIWQREGNASLNQSNVVLVQKLPERDLLGKYEPSIFISSHKGFSIQLTIASLLLSLMVEEIRLTISYSVENQ